jgi:hypothetical protein
LASSFGASHARKWDGGVFLLISYFLEVIRAYRDRLDHACGLGA